MRDMDMVADVKYKEQMHECTVVGGYRQHC